MNKYEQIKIFIPSKNRLDNEKTYNILKNIGLNPVLVIEPQEVEKAMEMNYEFIVLPENNKGISYSRNYILEFSKK